MALNIIPVKSDRREQLIEITAEVQSAVRESGIKDGICYIFTPHTTAAVTINENADPDVRADFIKGLAHLDFDAVKFSHMEGNSSAHIKSSLQRFSGDLSGQAECPNFKCKIGIIDKGYL